MFVSSVALTPHGQLRRPTSASRPKPNPTPPFSSRACRPLPESGISSFKETRFYRTMQSILGILLGSQSRSIFSKSSQKDHKTSEDTSHLHQDAQYIEIDNGRSDISISANDICVRNQKDSGIYRMVTVNVSSQNPQ